MNQCPACGCVMATLEHRPDPDELLINWLTEKGHCLMNMKVWWQVWDIEKNEIVGKGDTPRLAIENAIQETDPEWKTNR